MTSYRNLAATALLVFASATANAQMGGSNSSYSRFGLGILNDQSVSFSKGMGGASKGVRIGNRVNPENPASYSGIDSLTMVLDVGATLSVGQYTAGNARTNINNCSFDYVVAGFRLRRGLGFALGMLPYTTIGYNYALRHPVGFDMHSHQPIASYANYQGEGGMHQAFAGVGWQPFGQFSIGANLSYLWGEFGHMLFQEYEMNGDADNSFNGLHSQQSANVKSYKIDLGAQYSQIIDSENRITYGLTASLGHNLGAEAKLERYNSAIDTAMFYAKDAFDIPYTVGGGATWEHKGKLLVAADYTFEKWSSCKLPHILGSENEIEYVSKTGGYINRSKIALGAQYIPDAFATSYLKRMHYRLGANFSTPNLKVNGKNGPSEYGISAGVGLPISNNINHGPMGNITLQWKRRSASGPGMVTENYFLFSFGITFAENWFMKYRIR